MCSSMRGISILNKFFSKMFIYYKVPNDDTLILLQTGKSRGYGYIEFRDPEVAKIAAETMNNYLMCGRLVKSK